MSAVCHTSLSYIMLLAWAHGQSIWLNLSLHHIMAVWRQSVPWICALYYCRFLICALVMKLIKFNLNTKFSTFTYCYTVHEFQEINECNLFGKHPIINLRVVVYIVMRIYTVLQIWSQYIKKSQNPPTKFVASLDLYYKVKPQYSTSLHITILALCPSQYLNKYPLWNFKGTHQVQCHLCFMPYKNIRGNTNVLLNIIIKSDTLSRHPDSTTPLWNIQL
jgi:hypothetical protein